MCPYHTDFPVNLFCEQCNAAICSDCNHTSHRTHGTVPLMQKFSEFIRRLRSVLVACREQETEIERRFKVLNKWNQDIEDTTVSAVNQMEEQCKKITAEIGRFYNGQVDTINKVKLEEQSRFETEKSKLHKLNKLRKDLEETSKQLLEHTTSPDFISKSNTFFLYNHLKKLPEEGPKIRKRWIYRRPSYRQMLDPEEFREYVLQHILGYFAPERPGQHTSDAESLNQFKPYGAFTRSMPSLYSVSASSTETIMSTTSLLSYVSNVSAIHDSDEEDTLGQSRIQPTKKIFAELVSYVNLEKFRGSHLKNFSSAIFSRLSMWISGWNKSAFGKTRTVLLEVKIQDYKTINKKEKG